MVRARPCPAESLKNFPCKDIHTLSFFLLNYHGASTTEIYIDFTFNYIQIYRDIEIEYKDVFYFHKDPNVISSSL